MRLRLLRSFARYTTHYRHRARNEQSGTSRWPIFDILQYLLSTSGALERFEATVNSGLSVAFTATVSTEIFLRLNMHRPPSKCPPPSYLQEIGA